MAKVTLKGLAQGTSLVAFASVWRILSRIILTPVLLAKLGLEGYGVWALLFSITGSINMVGASFGLTYQKITAEFDAKGDRQGLEERLGSGMTVTGGFAMIGLIAVWLFREPLLTVLGVAEDALPSASDALLLVMLTLVMQMSIGAVTSVLAGLQRTDLKYALSILSSFIYFVGALVLLQRGWGLIGLAVSHLGGELITVALAWFWCRRLSPGLRISPLCATRRGFREIFSLGGRFQLLYLLNMVSAQGFRMLFSALLGPASLGIYTLGQRLTALGGVASSSILAPMMPAFASLDASGDREGARRMHLHGSRLVFLAGLVCLSFFAVFADAALELWTGERYPEAAWTVRALAFGYITRQLTGVGAASLRGQGILGLELSSMVVIIGIQVVVTAPLYLLWGYEGLVMSSVLAASLGSLWFLRAITRHEGVSFWLYLRSVALRPILVLVPVVALFAWANSQSSWTALFSELATGRWAVFLELASWGIAFVVSILAASWLLVLSSSERRSITRIASGAIASRRASPSAQSS